MKAGQLVGRLRNSIRPHRPQYPAPGRCRHARQLRTSRFIDKRLRPTASGPKGNGGPASETGLRTPMPSSDRTTSITPADHYPTSRATTPASRTRPSNAVVLPPTPDSRLSLTADSRNALLLCAFSDPLSNCVFTPISPSGVIANCSPRAFLLYTRRKVTFISETTATNSHIGHKYCIQQLNIDADEKTARRGGKGRGVITNGGGGAIR